MTEEERESIEVVSGDGARWITECVQQYCPQAKRCTDPFHIVEWANEALDEIRKESWRDANNELKKLKKKSNESVEDHPKMMKNHRD